MVLKRAEDRHEACTSSKGNDVSELHLVSQSSTIRAKHFYLQWWVLRTIIPSDWGGTRRGPPFVLLTMLRKDLEHAPALRLVVVYFDKKVQSVWLWAWSDWGWMQVAIDLWYSQVNVLPREKSKSSGHLTFYRIKLPPTSSLSMARALVSGVEYLWFKCIAARSDMYRIEELRLTYTNILYAWNSTPTFCKRIIVPCYRGTKIFNYFSLVLTKSE